MADSDYDSPEIAAIHRVRRKFSLRDAQMVVRSFGVDRVRDLPKERHAEFIAKCDAICNGAEPIPTTTQFSIGDNPAVFHHPDGSGRMKGESPRAFAKRKKQEAIDEEILRDEQKQREQREKQENCTHYYCEPTEWHWSGAIREMTCRDCGLTEYREEPNGEAS